MRTIGLLNDQGSEEIPASHRDLVQCPPVAALTTIMPNDYPQTSVVWCDFDGQRVWVNTSPPADGPMDRTSRDDRPFRPGLRYGQLSMPAQACRRHDMALASACSGG